MTRATARTPSSQRREDIAPLYPARAAQTNTVSPTAAARLDRPIRADGHDLQLRPFRGDRLARPRSALLARPLADQPLPGLQGERAVPGVADGRLRLLPGQARPAAGRPPAAGQRPDGRLE